MPEPNRRDLWSRCAPSLARGDHEEGLRAQNVSAPRGSHHVEKRPHGDDFLLARSSGRFVKKVAEGNLELFDRDFIVQRNHVPSGADFHERKPRNRTQQAVVGQAKNRLARTEGKLPDGSRRPPGVVRVDIEPYHPMGEDKNRRLGRKEWFSAPFATEADKARWRAAIGI